MWSHLRLSRKIITIAFNLSFYMIALHPANAANISVTNCQVVITGEIESGDDRKFQDQLREAYTSGCKLPSVSLYSPGGNIDVSIAIGRQIRALYLSTSAPRAAGMNNAIKLQNRPRICDFIPGREERWQRFEAQTRQHFYELNEAMRYHKPFPTKKYFEYDFDPNTGNGDHLCTCASACFFIWAAGAERWGNIVIIHRPFYERSAYAQFTSTHAEIAYAKLQTESRAYLIEVGVPSPIIEKMFSIPSTEGVYLSNEEIDILKVPPFLSELKVARCGAEPRLEDQSNEPFDKPLPGHLSRLSPQDRRLIIAKAEREICWRDSMNIDRKAALDALMRSRH